jgi:hypothetical protein
MEDALDYSWDPNEEEEIWSMTGGRRFSRTTMEVEEDAGLGVILTTSGLTLRYDVLQPHAWPTFSIVVSPTAQAFSPTRVRYGSGGLGNSWFDLLESQSEVRLPHFFDYSVTLGEGIRRKYSF